MSLSPSSSNHRSSWPRCYKVLHYEIHTHDHNHSTRITTRFIHYFPWKIWASITHLVSFSFGEVLKLLFSSPILHYIHSLSRLSFSGESRVPSTNDGNFLLFSYFCIQSQSQVIESSITSQLSWVKSFNTMSSLHITHAHMYKAVNMTMYISRV